MDQSRTHWTLTTEDIINTAGTTMDITNNISTLISTNNATTTTIPPMFVPCNNPHNLVSPKVAETVDLVVYAGMFPALVTAGVITNVINMAVFSRQGLSDRINLCLFSLALADTGFLLFLMCGKSYALVSLVSREAGSYWQQRNNVIVLGSHLGFIITSTAVTALIAIERCVCVVSPFKAKKFLKTRYIAIVILTMGIYALVVKNTALGLKYLTVKVRDPATNTTTFISRLTPFYLRHKTIIDIIYSDLLSVTVPTLSLVVVIVCTSVTVVKLKLSLQWRQKSNASTTVIVTSAEKREAAVTRMLVTVCCLYVICMTPSVMRTFALHRLPGFLISGYLCNTFKVTTALVHLLEVINASANFFIYLKQSSRYRATLFQMCSRFRCLRDTGEKSDAEMSVVSRSVANSRGSNTDCRRHLGQSKGPYNLDTEAGHM